MQGKLFRSLCDEFGKKAKMAAFRLSALELADEHCNTLNQRVKRG
jgi:hypothetical protein